MIGRDKSSVFNTGGDAWVARNPRAYDFFNRNTRKLKIAVSPSPSIDLPLSIATATRCCGTRRGKVLLVWSAAARCRFVMPRLDGAGLLRGGASQASPYESGVPSARIGAGRNVAQVFRPEGRGDGLASKEASYINCRQHRGNLIADARLEMRVRTRKINGLKISNRHKTWGGTGQCSSGLQT